MSKPQAPEHKPRPLLDVAVSIIVPSIILMKLSGHDDLGPEGALITALSFPVAWGLYELLRHQKKNFIALLGLISVLLTGGIGLLQLDNHWLAVKEAAIPGIIGLAVLASSYTRYPLVRTLLFNPAVIDVAKVQQQLAQSGQTALFERNLRRANFLLAGTFVFSSTMNYILAKWLVTSPPGTEAYNEELGEMTLLSYPIIAVPSMIMMLGIMFYLWRTLRTLAGLTLEDIIPGLQEESEDRTGS
ncbi:MAG: VC0807 family protein [Pseudomonadota bacterium]